MMAENIIRALKKIVNDYEAYSEIACSLEWKKCRTENFFVYCGGESCYDFQKVIFDEDIDFENPDDYIVQFFLQWTQYGEEWESDFWKELPYEWRKDFLKNASELYKGYITFGRHCFQEIKFDEFEKGVLSWGLNRAENPLSGYDFIRQFEHCKIISMGGDYFPDEYWMGMDKKQILLINFYCTG